MDPAGFCLVPPNPISAWEDGMKLSLDSLESLGQSTIDGLNDVQKTFAGRVRASHPMIVSKENLDFIDHIKKKLYLVERKLWSAEGRLEKLIGEHNIEQVEQEVERDKLINAVDQFFAKAYISLIETWLLLNNRHCDSGEYARLLSLAEKKVEVLSAYLPSLKKTHWRRVKAYYPYKTIAFIEKQKHLWDEFFKQFPDRTFVEVKHNSSEIGWSIGVFRNKRIYIYLRKPIAPETESGRFKRDKLALRVDTDEFEYVAKLSERTSLKGNNRACVMMVHQRNNESELLENEIECLKKCSGLEGAVQLYDSMTRSRHSQYKTTLFEKLYRRGALKTELIASLAKLPAQQIKVLYGIILALHNLHHRVGILHRDIKPDNIFVDQDWKVVLGDFGVSRKKEDQENMLIAPGSPLYMAPEGVGRRINKIEMSPYEESAADVWSLGCVLWEVLGKELPWDRADTEEELYDIQQNVERDLKPTEGNPYEAFVARFLRYRPEDRIPSDKMLSEFERILKETCPTIFEGLGIPKK